MGQDYHWGLTIKISAHEALGSWLVACLSDEVGNLHQTKTKRESRGKKKWFSSWRVFILGG